MRNFSACLFNKKRMGFLSLLLLITFNAFAFGSYEHAIGTEIVSKMDCTDPPIITCPSDYFGCPGDDTSTSALGSATAVAGGPDCGIPVVGHYDLIFTTGPCTGETFFKRVWFAYDPDDSTIMSECIQEITLIDNTGPSFTSCPANITAAPSEANCEAIVTWMTPVAADDCGTVTLTSNFNSGDAFPLGTTTTVIYTATDECGNESTCSFDVTVAGSCCFDPPTISCPANYTGCPGSSTAPATTGTAVGTPGGANCVTPSVDFEDVVISSGPCSGATVIERTWTATDPENPGSQATCLQTITLVDNVPPTLSSCPADLTVESTDGICAVATWTSPTGNDNCGLGDVVANFASGFCFSIGTTLVTYTATDNCGNIATCSFNVTVEDASCQTPPMLTCPSNYFACPGTSTDFSVTGTAVTAPGGPTCGNPSLSFDDVVVSVGPCPGATVINRTWTSTDPDDSTLISTCVQVITLSDNVTPVLSNCPNNINLVSNDGSCVVGTWTAPTATDNCGNATLSVDIPSGSCFEVGTTLVSYTATDACGNSVSCTFEVFVEDLSCQNGPLLTCPADYTECPGANDTDPKITGLPIVLPGGPNCGIPQLTFNDVVISTGSCGDEVIERTWTAVDQNDPSFVSTCVQTLSFIDTTDPVMTACPANQTLSSTDGNCVNATWISPTATDDCSGVSVVADLPSGSCFDIGITTVTYTASDDCGNSTTCNFTIEVIDNSCMTPPTITCPTNYNGCPADSTDPANTGSATASSAGGNCGTPEITFTDVISNPFSCPIAFRITRTWTATDPNNPSLFDSCVQTLDFRDNSPASITCPADATGTSQDGNPVTVSWTAPVTNDNCGVDSVTSTHTSGSTFPIGITTVTYTVTDVCGNETTCSFTVEVIDNSCMTPPTITCPADYYGCPADSSAPANTGSATANGAGGNCGIPEITFSDVVTNPFNCPIGMRITRTWTATDPNDASLTASCVQIINLRDALPPSITCPANITGSSEDGNPVTATWTAPATSDNCGVDSVVSTHNSGSSFPIGITTVTYTVTDICGNETSCSFTVEIVDDSCNTPPSITCPAGIFGCPTASTDPADTGYATATAGSGNCGTPVITFNDVISNPFGCSIAFRINRTWTATDPNDPTLKASCVQILDYKDNVDPVITCPGNITVDAEPGISGAYVSWVSPTGTDDCGVSSVTGSHTSGTLFPNGTTTVTYTVTDNCGNTATCSFVITVNPGFDLHCPNDITVQCDGHGGTPVTWELPTWKGGCGVSCDGGGAINGFIYMGEYNGHHYYCSNDPDTWVNAQATCVANGGHLAIINDASENTFIANFLTTQSAYIGCSDYQSEGNFTWVDGSPLTYTNWYTDQPNNFNGAQHFVEMLSNGQWNDQYGKVALEYVMEVPCSGLVQTSGPANGSELNTGVHTVCYEVTDECNNVASCCFDVTVESSISISCPNDVTFNVPTGKSGAIVTWNTPAVSSCCSSSGCSPGGNISGFVYMGNHNGSHYYCSINPDTWINAQATCEANGGNLAVVNDASENAYIAGILTTQSAYIGLSDYQSEGNFTWVDGSPLSYTNWYPNQPNNFNGAQHYVEMLSNGQWNDQYAKVALEYVMEIPACNSITQTTGPSSGSYFTAGTTTTITYEASDQCGNWASCSFDITIAASYCTSGGQNSKYVHIEKVEFGPISNLSGNNGGYGNFSNTCHNVTQGQSYPLQLTPGFSSSKYVVYWKVYCDWNNDFDFVDAGELLAYGAGSGPISGNYTIPKYASGSCRLRVVMKYGSYPVGPCSIFPHGETEDYCLNVVPSLQDDDIAVNYRSDEDAINLGEEIPFDYVVKDLDAVNDLEVAVYPNPAVNYTTIETSSSNDDTVEIQIINANGQVVKTMDDLSANNTTQVDVSGLTSGVYIINVHSNGKLISKRLIVNN